MLFQFIEAVGGTATADLNVFWVLLVTAAAAAFAALADRLAGPVRLGHAGGRAAGGRE
jgi:hypothetical protein